MTIEGASLREPAPPLAGLLGTGLSQDPDAIAMVSAERQMTWRELDRESDSLASAYLGLGLEPGDRIASLMPNRIGLVVHYLACFKAGLVVAPLNYRYTYREIDHALKVSGAKAILAHAERADDLAESSLASSLDFGTIAYGASPDSGRVRFEDLVEGDGAEPPPFDPAPADPAAIFFTSGSTGPARRR